SDAGTALNYAIDNVAAIVTTGCQAPVPDLRNLIVATDNCTPSNSLQFTQNPPPGTLLPRGDNTITFTATDQAGNTSTACQTTFTVADNTPPVLAGCANVSATTDPATACSAVVTYTLPTASD